MDNLSTGKASIFLPCFWCVGYACGILSLELSGWLKRATFSRRTNGSLLLGAELIGSLDRVFHASMMTNPSVFFLLRFTYMLTHRFPVLFGATNGPLGKMDFWSCNFLMLKSTISRVWWMAEVKTVLLLLSADNSLRIHWMNFPIQYAHVGTLLWWAGNKLHAIDMKQWESRRNIGRSSFIYTWGFYLQVRLVQVAIQQQRRDDRRTSLRVSYIFQL